VKETGPLVDESVLRLALRLDADEVPSRRLDPALIAAAARAGIAPRTFAVAILAAFAAGWIWSEAIRLAVDVLTAATGVDAAHVILELVAAVAMRLAPLADLATQPAIPVAIFAAATIAIMFERRGRTNAETA
jgi:hypothetical protein